MMHFTTYLRTSSYHENFQSESIFLNGLVFDRIFIIETATGTLKTVVLVFDVKSS